MTAKTKKAIKAAKAAGKEVFEMNGKAYAATDEVSGFLRIAVPRAKASGDYSAITAIMVWGLQCGDICELGQAF